MGSKVSVLSEILNNQEQERQSDDFTVCWGHNVINGTVPSASSEESKPQDRGQSLENAHISIRTLGLEEGFSNGGG